MYTYYAYMITYICYTCIYMNARNRTKHRRGRGRACRWTRCACLWSKIIGPIGVCARACVRARVRAYALSTFDGWADRRLLEAMLLKAGHIMEAVENGLEAVCGYGRGCVRMYKCVHLYTLVSHEIFVTCQCICIRACIWACIFVYIYAHILYTYTYTYAY